MVRIIFGIITILALLAGTILIFGGAVFYPEKKWQGNEKVMMRKRVKIKAIGYVVCLCAFLIGIILGSI